jgi:hypothetical protein
LGEFECEGREVGVAQDFLLMLKGLIGCDFEESVDGLKIIEG